MLNSSRIILITKINQLWWLNQWYKITCKDKLSNRVKSVKEQSQCLTNRWDGAAKRRDGAGLSKVVPTLARITRPHNNGSIPTTLEISILGVWIANASGRLSAKLQGFSADALLLGHAVRADGSGMYIRGGIPGIYPPVRLIVNWSSSRGTAVSLALSGSWRTFRSPGANSKTAIPDQAW